MAEHGSRSPPIANMAGKGAAVLMKAAPEDALRFHRVGTEVNSNRASGPMLIEPIEV